MRLAWSSDRSVQGAHGKGDEADMSTAFYRLPTVGLENKHLKMEVLADAGPRIVRLMLPGREETSWPRSRTSSSAISIFGEAIDSGIRLRRRHAPTRRTMRDWKWSAFPMAFGWSRRSKR